MPQQQPDPKPEPAAQVPPEPAGPRVGGGVGSDSVIRALREWEQRKAADRADTRERPN